jgi:hypothetical protein
MAGGLRKTSLERLSNPSKSSNQKTQANRSLAQ